MSLNDDFWAALNKKKKKELENSNTKVTAGNDYTAEFVNALDPTLYNGSDSKSFLERNFVHEDIAPVRLKKEDDASWFQKGAFEDGSDGFWDFLKNLGKTTVGTLTDVEENVNTAVVDATENLIDTAAHAVGVVGGWFDKGFREDVNQFVAKEILKPEETGKFMTKYLSPLNMGRLNSMVNKGETDENSILGEKADGLVQSGAHLVGSAALQYLGVPTWLTMGVNAFGSEIESAAQQGATFMEGTNSAVVSTAAEIVFERISSGIKLGGKTWDEGLKKWLTNKISDKILRTVVTYGADAIAEGGEEVATELVSAVGRKAANVDKREWNEIISSEEMFDAFIGGAVMSGVAGAGKIAKSTHDGVDYTSELTNNEEKVVKKLYEDAIAEKESDGTKLNLKEKNKIYDSIVDDMKKGQLKIDDIESVLGGETYEQYKTAYSQRESLVNKKAELQNELKKLEEAPDTIGNRNKYNSVEAEINGIDSKIKAMDKYHVIDNIKNKLNEEVTNSLQAERNGEGSILLETYRERDRRGQALDVDLSQYKGKQKEAMERAVKSGVLNNTYRAKELVSILSKIEADKGIVFDYTNNAKLKKSGFAVEGKTVNGFENNGTVTLNVQSSKSWQSVVGHEITHVLEGTDAYSELQTALFKYAEGKGELESRKTNLTQLYKGIENANIDAELTADLVGDYLFNDTDFIRSLTENRNVFQKIYDEIKYLFNVATGKEKAEIEKVKREFDKVWKEFSTKGINEELNEATDAEVDDVNYSISVEDEKTLDFLNEQVSRGEYNAETNPDGGYYVTYKSMSYWGTDEDGNAILRSPMAEYVDGELSNAYLIPKDKSKLNWYQSTETIDENTGLPSGLMVKTKKEGNKSFTYLPASENQDLIAEDWSNLYFNLRKKVQKNGKWVNSDVPARYNPYEHSSNSMLNDQFSAAYLRDNLVTVKMYVPVSEDNGAFRAKWSKDPTGWADWKTGTVAGKINKQKDLQRKVYLSRYAAPVEIVPDSEVAQAYKEYIDGTDVTIPDNVVSPNLLKELRNAGVPITESGKVTSKGGVEYDKTSKSYSPVKYSISSLDKSDYVTERQQVAKEMSKTLGVTEEKASKYIDDVNSIAKMIADDKERLSYEPSPNRSAFVSNAEYGGSIDFSTICKKRRLFTGTFEAIQNALPNTALTADEVLEIRKMMKDKGYEVSCGLCYVEGSRTNMGQYTKQFIERYKATNPEYVPNMAEMNTATGQEKIRKEHPEVYEAYEYFMNHYGRLSPSDKALFASQQKPKMYQMSTEYKGEILDNFGKKKESVDAKNRNGGLRLQSFSDFEIIHLIDSMQVIMDMSRVGLAGQAYTKVPDFAWAFGDTGLKINLSLIAKGVDENGRLVLDEVEGMKESDAMALRDRYSDNVGTILVAFNDEQLKAAMADERIDYIIPYHRSQWKTDQYEMMGLPENTKDYTPYQNESYIEPVYNKNGKKQRPNNYMPNNYWDFNKSGKENAEAYLQMCAENNRKPKFSHLLVDNQDGSYSLQPDGSTDGYWKTLIDFKMYNNDGIGVPQNPVTPDFNMEEAKRMLNEYTGGHAKFPVAKDIVDEFVSKHPDNIAPADVKYSISEDIQKSDADYIAAVESGDTETAQMMVDEAAKNAGYTRKLYHGTASKFNVFGFGRTGIFTTDNYDMAKTYGDNVISLYGKEGANVLTIDAQESPHYAIRVSKDVLDFSEYPLIGKKETYSTNDISLIAFREGYDVVVINNVYDNYSAASGNTENGLGTDVVYKDPNQVKSSEAITYDDEGNVIPLSKRFNAENDDFRYSLSELGEQPSSVGTPFNELYLDPSQDDIAPVQDVAKNATTNEMPMLDKIPILPDEQLESGTYAAIKPKREKQPSLKKVDGANAKDQVANVLTEEPKVEKKKGGILSTFVRNFVDKGAVFETLSLKTKNRALQDTYKAIGRSETKAQYFMENGKDGVKSLDSIRAEVEQSGKTKEFYEYLYHKHNVDRMSLESNERPNLERLEGEMKKLKLLKLEENQLRAIASEKITSETTPKRKHLLKTVREYLASKDVKNKPVFGYSVTAEMSQDIASKYESSNPKFKAYAKDVYDYMNHLRKMMVSNGVISPETAKLWSEMYPHYVPIHRAGVDGLGVNVPLDTNKTGINAPIKRATGGNKDILPLFDTMAERTIQTFKAIDKNRFGIELKNSLGSEIESVATSLDEAIDSVDTHESLLQEGKNGGNPTFTVFEGGDRVTFEITDEMYKAMKPTSEGLSYTNKVLNTASNLHRGLLTEYSVPFAVKNAIKDTQDVLLNSQHPARTYANFPVAIKELITKGKWYTEYMENGGGDNTYFDKQTNTFTKEKSALRRIAGFPLDKISDVNNFIERVPRLAEYIASRQKGASVDAAMLDAARVTTDFSAGGDVTKFLNRNGATFLNASVQGFAQNVRNVREAKAKGLKGWVGLAAKVTLAGLPAVLLNNLLWDDDEEYEELSDYVKDNYYVVAKYGDGKFVRIPKGRASAVIQDAFEQIGNTLTGNDEADWGNFFELVMSNLAPNNPIDNNIVAPIMQVADRKSTRLNSSHPE